MDNYDSFRRMQEMIEKMNRPIREWQKQSEFLRQFNFSNQSLLRIQEQTNIISNSFKPLLASEIVAQWNSPNVSGLLELVNRQHQWMEQIKLSHGFDLHKIHEWQNTISKLAHSPLLQSTITIPDQINDHLDELAEQLEVTIQKNEASNDLTSQITVRQTKQTQDDKDKMTWSGLLLLLLAIWQTIAPYHIEYLNSDQITKQMIEDGRKTSLLEQQLIIESQRLELEKEQLELIKEQSAKQYELEQKYDQLLKMLDPIIEEHKLDKTEGE